MGVDIQAEIKKRVVYGDDAFQEKVRGKLREKPLKDLPELRLLRKSIDVRSIKEAVARRFDIGIKLLEAKNKKEAKKARNIALYLCRVVTNQTFSQIGTEFGDLNETVVSRLVKSVTESVRTQREKRELIEEILDGLKSKKTRSDPISA